jgi:hypothetical protein
VNLRTDQLPETIAPRPSSQNGKSKVVVILRERGGNSVSAVFRRVSNADQVNRIAQCDISVPGCDMPAAA